MPTYSLECNDCGAQYEGIRTISERAVSGSCPNCESKDTKTRLTAPKGIKGSGEGWAGQRKGYMA